ncbi:histidine kinase N-terminal 7TM domain-containing diguanylate cyclase [Pelobacter seleniigenes]|uniref:histidine kinase N-terminal 7TM domain-containing diguanylate cyclase n=1 Tax=Pelobacter seleniigenes TaxID=407188 RepID=UPI0004A6C3EA|nr:diguanylate cyclase [Pelobacter seleniigenes]
MPELHINSLPSFAILLLIIAGFEVFFTALAFHHRRAVGGRSFLFLMLAMIVYTVGYAFEIASADLQTALFFSDIQYLGIPFIPFFLYSLIRKYLTNTNTIPLKLTASLLIIPICTFFMHLTTFKNNLFYVNPSLIFHEGNSILLFKKGPWYYVDSAYTIILVLMSLAYSIFRFIKNKKYRNNISLIILATAFPFFGYILYLLELAPTNFDINPLAFGASCPLLAIAIFQLSLFEIVPVARDHIFENFDQGIIVTNSENKLVDYNKSIQSIFPEIEKYRIGSDINHIPLQNRERQTSLYRLLNEEKTFIVKKNEEDHYYNIRKNIISDTNKSYGGIIYILSDITEEKKLEKQLHAMATTDSLTGIENRRNILEIGEKALEYATRYKRELSIIIFDIDHYKKINDTWGHQAGDSVLIEITRLCRRQIRESDSLGRYGGDEFILILPESSHPTALVVAEKLRSAIAETTISLEKCKITVTASFGIATLNKGETFTDLFNRADQRLYQVKKSGRNRVY